MEITPSTSLTFYDFFEYGNNLHEPEFGIDEIDYYPFFKEMMNFGFTIVMNNGKLVLIDEEFNATSKLLAQELSELYNYRNFEERLHNAYDYIELKHWNDELLAQDIREAMVEVYSDNESSASFLDVLDYIADNWILSKKERANLASERAERYTERFTYQGAI